MAHAAGLDMPEVHLFPSSVPNHAGSLPSNALTEGLKGNAGICTRLER